LPREQKHVLCSVRRPNSFQPRIVVQHLVE
jgi:hypothetical protein